MAGVAAGVGIYAFLKSEDGKVFKDKLKKAANDLKDEIVDLAEKGKQKMSDWEAENSTAKND